MQLMMSQPPVDVSSPAVATAVVDPPVVPVGEIAVYRITVTALEASVRWPGEMYVPPGLEMRAGGAGQILPMQGNVQRPITARNFHIRALRPGFYTLPAFEIEAYGKRLTVPETQLEVAGAKRPGHEPARRLFVQIARTNVFVGETISVSVLAPGTMSNVVSGLAQIQFNGEGIYGAKVPSRQSVEPREVNGRHVSTVIYESSITPITSGELNLSVQGFSAGMFFTGPVVLQGQLSIQGGGVENTLLDSEPITLHVQPVPLSGEGQGFTGFIGALSVEPPRLSTNSARVGDALRLLVTFTGPPLIGRLIPPPPPRVEGWQIFAATPADPLPRPRSTNQAVAFVYTLIPTTEEVKQTPVIPFQVFDPLRATYLNVSIPPVPVQITAEGLPTNWVQETAALAEDEVVEERPRLTELRRAPGTTMASLQPAQSRASFLLGQFGPVIVLLGWWGYERRRQYLAAHPEILRRRAARRALRRERRTLHHAWTRQDASGFARSAVSALQIVSAPHYPAEPAAMVCGDVLNLFPQTEQSGPRGNIVRQLFAQIDATNYARSGETALPLFTLKPDLDQILKQLEARL